MTTTTPGQGQRRRRISHSGRTEHALRDAGPIVVSLLRRCRLRWWLAAGRVSPPATRFDRGTGPSTSLARKLVSPPPRVPGRSPREEARTCPPARLPAYMSTHPAVACPAVHHHHLSHPRPCTPPLVLVYGSASPRPAAKSIRPMGYIYMHHQPRSQRDKRHKTLVQSIASTLFCTGQDDKPPLSHPSPHRHENASSMACPHQLLSPSPRQPRSSNVAPSSPPPRSPCTVTAYAGPAPHAPRCKANICACQNRTLLPPCLHHNAPNCTAELRTLTLLARSSSPLETNPCLCLSLFVMDRQSLPQSPLPLGFI